MKGVDQNGPDLLQRQGRGVPRGVHLADDAYLIGDLAKSGARTPD